MNIFLKKQMNVIFFIVLTIFSKAHPMQSSQNASVEAAVFQVILNYQQSLSHIAHIATDAPAELKAKVIVTFLTQFYPVGFEISPEQETLEKTLLEEKIAGLINAHLPLMMHMPGLPFKSQNTVRCIAQTDLADYLCLFTLNHLAQGINQVYSFAGPITVYSDGYIFKTIYDPVDLEIAQCHQQWKVIAQKYNLSYIRINNGLELVNGTPQGLRAYLAARSCGMTFDKETLVGQSIYIKHDLINHFGSTCSKNALKKMATKLAPEILGAVKAYSLLLQEFIDTTYGKGNTIRLSPSKTNKALSTKFPISFIQNQSILPWNSFAVVDLTNLSLELACDTNKALEAGAQMVYVNGLACYVKNT